MIDKNIKLLVVDDNTQIRDLIRLSFKRQPKVDVFEAVNGLEGLKLFQELHPDIVLSDVMMPSEINGLSLCKQIKESVNKCPVELISGKCQQSDIYKVKPFGPIDLINIVNDLVN
jgi:CheY-like chemotaxis protein